MHREGMSDSQCESPSQAREQQEQGLEGGGGLASREDQGEHERGMCEGGCEGACVKDTETEETVTQYTRRPSPSSWRAGPAPQKAALSPSFDGDTSPLQQPSPPSLSVAGKKKNPAAPEEKKNKSKVALSRSGLGMKTSFRTLSPSPGMPLAPKLEHCSISISS